ncbi:DUF1593-domain-containing protein [Karstenula rhodostoma CBS 690.94]|uniref:DUF1593-domain-containing protein n=1 Tax=Karstenula rhodostoma CBS 690.94 TaxID=1392251 RepID=A0A9P4UFA4_9PLEO|nr:DUF1593-domain-containing protein [Karstenula rhodostoma CBS 690.94]
MIFSIPRLLTIGLLASVIPAHSIGRMERFRTVVTTDMEQDDLASLVRYILYTNELDTEGIIYTSSKYHWAGDGKGTKFFLPNREYNTSQTSWRWTGTRMIEDILLKAYAEIYPNLRVHDSAYPTAKDLLSKVKIGNIVFEGEMDKDTDGSNLIKSLLLDDDRRTLYLQAWGGTNTIARALKSISDQYSHTKQWRQLQTSISRKAVILASSFQDQTYVDYIAPNWPGLRVEDFATAYNTWGFNCNKGQGNVRALPKAHEYFTGAWIKANIQIGPLGRLYRSWLDGQHTPGDQLDVFGNYTLASAPGTWCKPLGPYDFLSEGDNVAFNPLLTTGLQDPSNPALGGWGGRSKLNSSAPELWRLVASETAANGSEVRGWTTDRWIAAASNEFAARMQWGLKSRYSGGNHAPEVRIVNGGKVKARAGQTVKLAARVSDPDRDAVTVSWWQYLEEGTYPGEVAVGGYNRNGASVKVPADARSGQTISVIVQATDDGEFPLTRYDRVIITVK